MDLLYWELQGYVPELHTLIEDTQGNIKGYIVKPVHIPQRKLSRHAMMSRFTSQEKGQIKALQLSGDITVSVFMEELLAATVVDLDLPSLLGALTYLQDQGIITPERIGELTQDATPTESRR